MNNEHMLVDINVLIENGNYYYINRDDSTRKVKSDRQGMIDMGFMQKVLMAERKAKLEKLLND